VETVSRCDFHDAFDEVFLFNDNIYPNKGMNEFYHIRQFLSLVPLDPESYLVKITGRYEFHSPYLIEQIKQTNGRYDIYYKCSKDIYGPQDTGAHTFLFGIKLKKLLQFIESIDYASLDPVELSFKEFCLLNNSKEMDKLDVIARPFGRPNYFLV
jgi:hypothetical protein